MFSSKSFHISLLERELLLRQERSPLYSLRAFARDMNVHPSTLSLALKGKRNIPLAQASFIAQELNLNPEERTLFVESNQGFNRLDLIKIQSHEQKFILDETHDKIVKEWEHLVVLELFNIKSFKASVAEVSSKLDITLDRATEVLENLIECDLLTADENGVYPTHKKSVRTSEDVPSEVIRQSHFESLEFGKKKLENIPVEMRDFSKIVMSFDKNNISEAKAIIREFRRKMDAFSKSGNHDEVFQLAIQFYPMTDLKGNS